RRQPALGADGADTLRRRGRHRAISHDPSPRKGFRRMTDVADKTAFITGGASGLGLATAKALVAKGAAVILADIDGAGAEAAAASLRSAGGKALGLQLDVTSEESWSEAGAKARVFGPVRILFSNAGVGGGS